MDINEQRREVIERLRARDWKGEPPECVLNYLVFGAYCQGIERGFDDVECCDKCERNAVEALAELLVPQCERTVTVEMERWCDEDDLHPYEWVGVFSCGHTCYSHYGPVEYCNDCGSKVVRDGD